MFLRRVAKQLAQFHKVTGLGDGAAHALLPVARATGVRGGEGVEGTAADAVAEADDRGREEEGDGAHEELEDGEDEGEQEGEVFVGVQPADEGEGGHCGMEIVE